jgi:hypothetical protein
MGWATPFRRSAFRRPDGLPGASPDAPAHSHRCAVASLQVTPSSRVGLGPPCPERSACALRPEPSLSFLLPSAHAGRGGPPSAGLPHPLRSALRVSLPSRRFAPPGSWPTIFQVGSAPGIPPFGGFPSRKVPSRFPPPTNPRAVQSAVAPSGEPSGRTDGPRLPGLIPFESASPSVRRLAESHGRHLPWAFILYKALHRTPSPSFRPESPHALPALAVALTAKCPAPQGLNRRSTGSFSDNPGVPGIESGQPS